MNAEQPSRAEVAEFLGTAENLQPLTGGAWSSAWAYRADGEDLVVRFGRERAWYEADRTAMAFAGPDLPVPAVKAVGTTPTGRAYAISVRHYGSFLEDTPVDRAAAIAPALTRLLLALYRVPSAPDLPVMWHDGGEFVPSWREFLRSGLVDNPAKLVHGWSAALAADPELAPLSEKAANRITELVDACPERRDLIHGDLLHGNVLVRPDTSSIEAVLSWKCSVRGDFLFERGVVHILVVVPSRNRRGRSAFPSGQGVTERARRAPGCGDPAPLLRAAHRLYASRLEAHWTGDRENLTATARRLAEILDRGPLQLPFE